MPSSNHVVGRPYWSSGRGFTSSDPERQREVVGYVRKPGRDDAAPARASAAKSDPLAWTRLQPDVDSSGYEGSSSRRWR
ncbi:MAG TPA: hypothetical protein VFM98_23030 [Ramlibacter sp.]|uniref:hypothetical protein n=1 Tax=Ramlibacter sp. TaxID=1917967 RepID=UPI002D7F5236|nr:hypothetical protein [Ramlibacter sp.]HET8748487.1 hypothetical protein [Ramlibacter sp.]